VISDGGDELVWLVEHPPLYTAGTSANKRDLVQPDRFPVFATGRGGEYTYHGPGQRVAYVMLDLKRRRQDVRAFVAALEDVVIRTLDMMNVRGERREDRVGVWVRRPEKPLLADGTMAEDKIAALGIRLRKWVTFHGLSLNVDPDLDHFGGIVPCGISAYGVTSLVDLGLPVMMADVDIRLRTAFEAVFGETTGET
jgi:lipoyl(octanoyl) transferase